MNYYKQVHQELAGLAKSFDIDVNIREACLGS